MTRTRHRDAVARKPRPRPPEPNPAGDFVVGAAARIWGSWAYVAGLAAFLIAWLLLNGAPLLQSGAPPFDPHPYLVLNLILSALAAFSAPVVLMSLNRQSRRDRDRAERDIQMTLRLERDIAVLHEKIETMRDRELADILAHQVELLQELRDRPRSTAA